ncbi:hypothetical protein [Nocardia brevicatena]|uniref:hypothetical protein n=1 Tax=Nocardia brevicatena TaxID=37327 RepID=UPI0002E1FDB5|nr:hypothetical protein [Nocardia brevicatena]
MITGKDEKSSPEYGYHVYLKYDRPRHELRRQWCGYQAVTFRERLGAAETEARRLDILVAELVNALRECRHLLAEEKERELEQERVTPQNSRPATDCPLEPREMPVVYLVRSGSSRRP